MNRKIVKVRDAIKNRKILLSICAVFFCFGICFYSIKKRKYKDLIITIFCDIICIIGRNKDEI